jgi:hypothetical protein
LGSGEINTSPLEIQRGTDEDDRGDDDRNDEQPPGVHRIRKSNSTFDAVVRYRGLARIDWPLELGHDSGSRTQH